jgi:hypothetical protein
MPPSVYAKAKAACRTVLLGLFVYVATPIEARKRRITLFLLLPPVSLPLSPHLRGWLSDRRRQIGEMAMY